MALRKQCQRKVIGNKFDIKRNYLRIGLTTTTFDFSGEVHQSFKWKKAIQKENHLKSYVLNIAYESCYTNEKGELQYNAAITFYLPAHLKIDAGYLVNYSLQGGHIIFSELKNITCGFIQNKNLKMGVYTMKQTKQKWQHALDDLEICSVVTNFNG